MDSIRTISRGLDVIDYLNVVGSDTAAHIANHLGLARPSTYRMLETLAACGMVCHSAADNHYSLAWGVRTLSSGLTDENLILWVATPILFELQAQLLWPTDLATHDNGQMVIQETTRSVSPYSIEPRMVGTRHPMLLGSLGRAFLGYCSDEQREEIFRLFASRCSANCKSLSSRETIERIIAQTQANGYGARDREVNAKTSSIAVPIMYRGRVAACMDVNWIASAMPFDVAVARFLPALDAARKRIEAELISPPGPVRAGIAEGPGVGPQLAA